MNEEYRVGHVAYDFNADFNERVEHTNDKASSSKALNIGYFYLQEIMQCLKLKDLFSKETAGRKNTFDATRFCVFWSTQGFLIPAPSIPCGNILKTITRNRTLTTNIFSDAWISFMKAMRIS